MKMKKQATLSQIARGTKLCCARNLSEYWYFGRVITVTRVYGNWVYYDTTHGEDSFSTDGIGDFDIIEDESQAPINIAINATRAEIERLEQAVEKEKQNLKVLIEAGALMDSLNRVQ